MSTKVNNNESVTTKVNNTIKSGKNDIKNISPFFYINSLTKLAKKNEYCNHINVKEICKILVDYVKANEGSVKFEFNANLLRKDSKGRFVYLAPRKLNVPFATIGDEIDYDNDIKGRDVIRNEKGEYCVLQPIKNDLTCYFNAFCEIARNITKGRENEEKKQAKRAKEFEKMRKGIVKDFSDGIISESEFCDKLNTLKAQYVA